MPNEEYAEQLGTPQGTGSIIHLRKEGREEGSKVGAGYGFIQSEQYDRNLFFHARFIKNSRFDELEDGMKVEFAGVVKTEKGLQATAVYLVRE